MEKNTPQTKNLENRSKVKGHVAILTLQALFIINSAIWFVYGVLTLLGLTTEPDQINTMRLLSLFMFADAVVLFVLFIGTLKKHHWAYNGAFIVLIINIILSVTDEFGFEDLIVLTASLAALIMLLTNKPTFDSYQNNK